MAREAYPEDIVTSTTSWPRAQQHSDDGLVPIVFSADDAGELEPSGGGALLLALAIACRRGRRSGGREGHPQGHRTLQGFGTATEPPRRLRPTRTGVNPNQESALAQLRRISALSRGAVSLGDVEEFGDRALVVTLRLALGPLPHTPSGIEIPPDRTTFCLTSVPISPTPSLSSSFSTTDGSERRTWSTTASCACIWRRPSNGCRQTACTGSSRGS